MEREILQKRIAAPLRIMVKMHLKKKYKAHKEKLDAKPSLPESNVKHIAMNKTFIAFAVSGSVLLLLGYSLGPEGCENSTISSWETPIFHEHGRNRC